MHISINERLRPFNHELGTMSPVPGSRWCVQVFPSLIRLYDLSCKELRLLGIIHVDIQGPVTGFTLQLDLEKGFLHVWGNSLKGYFRYRIAASLHGEKLLIKNEKETHPISFSSDSELISISNLEPYTIGFFDRLSLGVHKAQEWTLIKKRLDFKEIFPIWLKLGQLMSPAHEEGKLGTASFLTGAEELICQKNKTDLLNHFQRLFLTGFYGLMTPTLVDHHHQGIHLEDPSPTSSPLVLLSYGAKLIRSLFVSFQDSHLSVLPALPVEFHSGRFLHVRLENLGLLDLEWSKKTVRRMILLTEEKCTISLGLPKQIKRFRFKEEQEKTASFLEAGCKLHLEKGKAYFFDRFEK